MYGYDYPEDASPFSFVTRTELERIAGALRVTTGMRFADIACGQAGPSLCVARATGAFVIGIDSSEVAIGAAKTAAGARGLAHRAAFLIADAAATGLRSASTDGVMSIDALQLMKHRDAVLAEIPHPEAWRPVCLHNMGVEAGRHGPGISRRLWAAAAHRRPERGVVRRTVKLGTEGNGRVRSHPGQCGPPSHGAW